MGGTIKDPMGEVRDLSGSCTIEQLKAAVVAVKAARASQLHCAMHTTCTEPVTHIDSKGYAYCTGHGVARRVWCPCRKLRPHELRKLQRGETIKQY